MTSGDVWNGVPVADEVFSDHPFMPKAVLTSWKEIAEYLGKGIRTVQRWEDDLALPVRRTGEKPKAAIFAVPEEIDAWVKISKV
jgi:hypothetical protein